MTSEPATAADQSAGPISEGSGSLKTIVVAVGTEFDEPWITDAAAELANETGARVVVVAVDDVESQRFEPLPLDEYLERAQFAASRAAGRLSERGIDPDVLVRSGPATRTIIEAADEVEADLIVVGSSDRGPLAQRLLGRLALELVQRARRQVMVVTEPSR